MTHDYNDTDNALQSLCWYNGYEALIDEVISDVETYGVRGRSSVKYKYGSEEYIISEVIWVLITCKFGDYGTSPRFGWIEKKDEAIQYLKFLKSEGAYRADDSK